MPPSAGELRLRGLVDSWRSDATKRRRVSAHDPIADAIEFCADELRAELEDVSQLDRELTTAEYADLHHVAVSTVRRWCRQAKIRCRPNGREYLIRQGEPRPQESVAVA